MERRLLLPPLEPLLRNLAEHRPELAERLERLRHRDPERYEQILMEVFMVRVERFLDEAGEALDRHHEHRPPPDKHRPEHHGPPPHEREFEHRMHALHERNEDLERRSHELTEKYHRLRDERAEPEQRERLHDELMRVVHEHFEVRTELRHAELERIERELHHLRETVERMRNDFERRQRERGMIIERRVRQLLGDDFGGW